MRFKFYLFIVLLVVMSASAAHMYKYTDNNGNDHFSDQPRKNAKVIHLKKFNQINICSDKSTTSNNLTGSLKKTLHYTITIRQPENKATIRNNTGSLTISFKIKPMLKAGDQLQLIFDGKVRNITQKMDIQLINIERGSHHLGLEIIDQHNKIIAASKIITIYMHRPRITLLCR